MSEEIARKSPQLTREGLAAIIASAEKGNPQAQRDLGCMYWWGEELPKDDEKSRYWYTKAADQGHCQSMWDVSTMYLAGEGGPIDVPRALEYLRRAASRRRWHSGSDEAAWLLAQIHRKGDYGVAKDEEQAAHWESIERDLKRKKRGWNRHRRKGYFGITAFTAGQ